MNPLIIVIILLVLGFLVGIVLSTRKAAKRGEKYIGTDDAIERWTSKENDNQAGRYWTRWWG